MLRAVRRAPHRHHDRGAATLSHVRRKDATRRQRQEILARYGGIWITTDIHTREWAQRSRDPIRRETETERLGRDLDPNYFDDVDHARTFFEGCGFKVESRPLLEGIRDQVISLPQAPKELVAELNERCVFVLHRGRRLN